MKYTVVKTGYILSEDDVDELLEENSLNDTYIRSLLEEGTFFFASKPAAEKELTFCTDPDTATVLKKQIKVTVEVLDVQPVKAKRNTNRKPNSKKA